MAPVSRYTPDSQCGVYMHNESVPRAGYYPFSNFDLGTEAMKVLIVEDDESLRRSAARMLKYEGFDIVEAINAEEACSRCADHAPDLLFTDIQLPGTLNGWDVAERCRERDPRIPVVYTTAFPGHAPRPVRG